MSRLRLGEILIQAGVLDRAGLDRALQEQRRWGRGQLGQYLVQLGLVSEEMIVRALSMQCNIPAVALDPERVDLNAVRFIPDDICQRHRLVCIKVDRERRFLDVAMCDPASLDAVDEVRVATRYNVRPYFAMPSAIERALGRAYDAATPLGSLPAGAGASAAERAGGPAAPLVVGRHEISFDEVSLAEVGALELERATDAPRSPGSPLRTGASASGGAPPAGGRPLTAAAPPVAAGRATRSEQPAAGAWSSEDAGAALARDDRGAQLAQLERQLRAQGDRFAMLLQMLRAKGMLSGEDLSRLGGS